MPVIVFAQKDIFSPLKMSLEPFHVNRLVGQLVIEGLVKKHESDGLDISIEITSDGYEAIDLFGNYFTFKQNKRQKQELERSVNQLNVRYLRLKTWSIVITIISTIISFTVGVLLSDPIKELFHRI